MKQYEELAHATSAPIEPCRERLKGPLLALTFYKIAEYVRLCRELDEIKRAVFYGKGDVQMGLQPLHGEAKEFANEALDAGSTMELIHAGIGLATESGEFLDALFNHIFVGDTLDLINLREEIGDFQWYAAKAAKFTGTTLEIEQRRNIAKLAKRYGAKFSDADALIRDLDAERAVLEKEVDGEADQP